MAEKLFIDLDEEIVFIIDKIKNSSQERIILIVPEHAALLGSVVSLKLLASEVAFVNKDLIIVSEDEIGQKLAKRAQLMTVNRVGDITDELWEQAHSFNMKRSKSRGKQKDILISERVVHSKDDIEKNKVEHLQKIPDLPEILTPQYVNVNGFEMVSGGDINQFSINDSDNSSLEKPKNASDSENMSEHIESDLRQIDFSHKSQSRDKEGNQSSQIYSYKNKLSKKKTRNIPLLYIKIACGILISMLCFGLYLYFILPYVQVTIKFKNQNININQQVVADINSEILNIDTLTIPAKYSEESLDRSDSADTTGTTQSGDKANGKVTVFNRTDKSVTLQAGTVMESVETGLKYVTTTTVIIPATVIVEQPGNEVVGLAAEKFGKEYNTEKTLTFKIQGQDVSQVYGKNYSSKFTGGTTIDKKIVSQKDYDSLKEKLQKSLEADLLGALRQKAGQSTQLLEDTIKYSIVSEESTPKVNSEGATFTVSINMKAVALTFSKEDIETLSRKLIEKGNSDQMNIENFNYQSEIVETMDTQIKIDLTITGIAKSGVDDKIIRSSLQGKSKSDALKYLSSLPNVDTYTLDVLPVWLPTIFQHIPSSERKIAIQVEN